MTARFGSLPNCSVFEKRHYPGKMISDAGWNAWTVDDEGRKFPFNIARSEESVVEALVDLLILSCTTPTVGTYSTFFTMARIFAATRFFEMQKLPGGA